MNKKAEKLLLIDGHSIASRAYYGVPLLSNAEGLHTNAIHGFLNILLNTCAQTEPDYIAVAFDMREKTFRHKMYDAYKGNRKGMPEELLEQIPVLEEVLNAMRIPTIKQAGYEADDVLGTLAKRAEADGMDVVVLSGDRDLLQLATDKTMIVIPKTRSYGNEIFKYYADDVEKEYQVTPSEFIDLKALMGDASDNIPGIPGIGEKRATSLIVKYKTIENAISHADEVTPPKVSAALKEHAETGLLSKKLATIITDAPVSADFHNGKLHVPQDFFNPDSYAIYKKLELKKLLERFDQDVIGEASTEEITYELAELTELKLLEVNDEQPIGFYADEAVSVVSVSGTGFTKIFLPAPDNREALLKAAADLFRSGRTICVFGLKSILRALKLSDFISDNVYDMEVMAYLIDPNSNDYHYDAIANTYLNLMLPSKADLLKKVSVADAMTDESLKEAALRIAASHSAVAYQVFPVLRKQLEEAGMEELLEQVEMPLVYSLFHMEEEGVAVDKTRLEEFSSFLETQIGQYQKEIFTEAGTEFNLNSPKQLSEVLFERMKLPAGKKTKNGYSTAADVLEKLAVDYPVVNKILLYRQAAKLKSTYADGLTEYIAEDGRIHGTFNQTVTATGRISSSDPNLQNIPTRTELGQEIRKAFVAKEGCVLLDADYSQIELRLLAHMSGDENLIEAYKSDEDIHRITASKVFHTPLNEVTKEQRRNAKAVNFGIVYGISSFGLSQDLSITRKEAENYIKQYFATYPKVKTFLDETVRLAKINGFTTTLFGRRRPIPELKASNAMIRAFGERAAMNAPIQGTAADIMKIAMINVEKKLKEAGLKSAIVLQVHDELIVEAPIEEKEAAAKILTEEMKHAAYLTVPLIVECSEGHDWYEAH